MDIDMSLKELKAASTAFAVAAEIAKRQLGKGEYVDPGILLQGFTDKQLDEFIRIMRALERDFDDSLPQANAEESTDTIIQDSTGISSRDRKQWRAERGGYGEEKHGQGK